ncbi:hypothetical protein [Ferruginibacter profundus]
MKKRKAKNSNTNKSGGVSVSKLTFHKLDWLEWVTIGLGIWFLFFPKPYIVSFSILLAMPVIGLLLNGIHKPSMATLVTISKDKDEKDTYDVADFIDVAAWVILLRVILDFEFESWYSLILPGTVASIIMLVLLFATHRQITGSNKNKTWIYLSLIFNICLYSYAGTYAANCVYDFSEPAVYQAEVVDKHIGGTKHKTYYLKVTPWGHHYDKENISVTREQYNETLIGETVDVNLKKGLFNIPWYYASRR